MALLAHYLLVLAFVYFFQCEIHKYLLSSCEVAPLCPRRINLSLVSTLKWFSPTGKELLLDNMNSASSLSSRLPSLPFPLDFRNYSKHITSHPNRQRFLGLWFVNCGKGARFFETCETTLQSVKCSLLDEQKRNGERRYLPYFSVNKDTFPPDFDTNCNNILLRIFMS